MARPRKELDTHGQVHRVLKMFKKARPGWKKERLNAIKLGLEGKLSNQKIAKFLEIHPDTLNNWFNFYRQGGIKKLLEKKQPPGRTGALSQQQMQAFKNELEKGKWRTGKQAYAWLKEKFGVSFHPNRIYQYLGKLGGRLKVPRPSHRKKDEQKSIRFKESFMQQIIDLDLPRNRPMRFWVYDEPSGGEHQMRYGLAPVTRRMWTIKGKEIIAPVHKRYKWGYVFGAVQIAGGGSEFLYSSELNPIEKL